MLDVPGATPKKGKKPVNLGSLLADAVAPAVKAARVIDKEQQRPHPKTSTPLHAVEKHLTLAEAARYGVGGSGHAGTKSHGGGGLGVASVAGLAEAALTLPQVAGKALHVPAPLLAGTAGPLGLAKTLAPRILGNSFKDAVEIPGEAIPSTYHAFEPLAHGDFLTTGKRLVDPYIQTALHPKQAIDHPLGTYLLAEGLRGGVGHAAGFTARSGIVGKSAQRAASLRRVEAALPGTTGRTIRPASKDLMVNQAQKAIDRRNIKKATELRDRADRVEQAAGTGHGVDSSDLIAKLRAKADKIDPRLISDKEMRTRVDETQHAEEGVRRGERGKVLRAADKITGWRPSGVLRLVSEGTVKATREDIAKHLTELEDAHTEMNARLQAGDVTMRPKIRANEALRKQITKDLKRIDSGKLNLARVKAQADEFTTLRNQLDEHLGHLDLIDKGQANRRRLLPAAVRNLGLKYDEAKGFVDDTGRVVPTDEIRAALAHPDRVAEPAYLSQAPNSRGARNYYANKDRPASVGKKPYTGEATRMGTYDAHRDVYRESIARAQTLISQQEGFTRSISEFAARHKNGKMMKPESYTAAMKRKAQLEAGGSHVEWTAIRLNPFAGSKAQLAKLAEDASATPEDVVRHTHDDYVSALTEAVNEQPKGGEGGPWTLIPKEVAQRQLDHAKLLSPKDLGKAWGKLQSVTRRVVLLTPHFVELNGLEAAFRGIIKGSLPIVTRSFYDGRKALKMLEKIDPEAHAQLMERGIGQGQYGFADRSHIHRPIDGEGKLAHAAGAVRASGPGRAAVTLWDRSTHVVFTEVNGRMERQFKTALAGKFVREQLLPKDGLKLSHDAWQQAAQGLRNTPEQVAMGRYVNRAYGKYGSFSPQARKFLQLYTPFGAWLVNATNFLARVLPRDHPVLTSLLASASQTSADWRKQYGLTQFNAPGVNRPPGFLQNTVPGKDGSHLRAFTQGTPFGLASDIGSALNGQILPTTQGMIGALGGHDFTGKQLRDTYGQPADIGQNIGAAIKEAAGVIVPGYGMYEQGKKAGGSPGHKARRLLDPFMFTQSHAPAESDSGGGSSGHAAHVDPVQQVWDRIRANQQTQARNPAVDRVWARIHAAQQGR